jgi:hypothetical protein
VIFLLHVANLSPTPFDCAQESEPKKHLKIKRLNYRWYGVIVWGVDDLHLMEKPEVFGKK